MGSAEPAVADLSGKVHSQRRGIPDLRWVNRHLPMRGVCSALELRLGPSGMIHCWHSERHKAGDRTPSVGICKSTNRLRCFGCGSKNLSVIDVVMDVQSTTVAGAVRWLQEHFELKYIPKGQHLKDKHAIRQYEVGHEKPIELLIKSGIWATLAPATQRIAQVLLCFAKPGERPDTFEVQLSYRAIQRYSGVRSFTTISDAIHQLADLEWLKKLPQANIGTNVVRKVNTYVLTPYSDTLMETANSMAGTNRLAIEQERELRTQQRNVRRHSNQASEGYAVSSSTEKAETALLKSTSLYNNCSVGQNGATGSVAEDLPRCNKSGISGPSASRSHDED